MHREDIEGAMALLEASKYIGEEDDQRRQNNEPISAIYRIITDFFLNNNKPEVVRVVDVRPMIIRKGFKDSDITSCLDEYEDLAVWTLAQDRASIRFITQQYGSGQ